MKTLRTMIGGLITIALLVLGAVTAKGIREMLDGEE